MKPARLKVAITGLNEFELALKDLRSLNKDSNEFCQALQDGRGDSKSLREKYHGS